MGIPVAVIILALVWFGSKRPMFRALATLLFTLECLLFREDNLSVNDGGFWVIVLMVIAALLFFIRELSLKRKKSSEFIRGITLLFILLF